MPSLRERVIAIICEQWQTPENAVLSATLEAGHLEEVVKAGADAVLEKVVSSLSLASEVRRLVGG